MTELAKDDIVAKPEPLEFNMEEVVKNARTAYAMGGLQAQHGFALGCSYAGPCAIGVSIPIEDRAGFDGYCGHTAVGVIASKGGFLFTTDEELRDAELLQRSHDAWTTCGVTERDKYEAEFVNLLDELETKYVRPTPSA